MDVEPLRLAYARLLRVARRGAFHAPADSSAWAAEEILAHVVATGRLLVLSTAELLAGGQPHYSDSLAHSRDHLAGIVASCGDVTGLVAAVRATSLELLALAQRFDGQLEGAEVPVSIGGEEQTLAWGRVLSLYAERQLPAHTADLEALSG